MPVISIEAPPGIRPAAKKTLMKKTTSAVDDAYHIGDTLIFLREYPVENVAMDGSLQSENPKILEALKKIGVLVSLATPRTETIPATKGDREQ